MIVESGLSVYVLALLVGLSFSRLSAVITIAGATAVAVSGTLLALNGVNGINPADLLVWYTSFSPVVETYQAGLTFFGTAHYDVQVVSLFCLAVSIIALNGYNCSGWNVHEYAALLFLLLVSSLTTLVTDHLAVLYLTLELQALTAYTLVGYYRVRILTTESALKYLLVGSAVSGFMLVGLFQLYYSSGTFSASELRFNLVDGSVWLFGALLFKVGAAPFHFWSPSVYESVEWPTLAALVSFAKLNIWVLLFVFLQPVTQLSNVWWLTVVAGLLSILAGAIGGLFQTSVGGVLGYSAVLNSGYLFLLISIGHHQSTLFSGFLYIFVYSLVAAAVCVVLASAYGNRPLLAGVTTLGSSLVIYYLMLNLGGLPVYPGFASKLYLLWTLSATGLLLGVLVVGASVFAVYYYIETSSFFVFDVAAPAVNTGNNQSLSVGALTYAAGVTGVSFLLGMFFSM